MGVRAISIVCAVAKIYTGPNFDRDARHIILLLHILKRNISSSVALWVVGDGK